VRVVTPPEFSPTVLKLLADPSERAALGRRAAETLRSQMGATAHTLDALEKLLAVEAAPAAQAAARVQ
jgi:hypothetical protein